ncbi:MAG TPA: hypothetical protein VGH48_13590 [Caldimonas sp.]|jgi:hypothetical protein
MSAAGPAAPTTASILETTAAFSEIKAELTEQVRVEVRAAQATADGSGQEAGRQPIPR